MDIYKHYINTIVASGGGIPSFIEPYISTESLLRLKDIGYFCGMDYASKNIYNFSEYISRYDHSISTALLTWRFTNDKTQTIAALIHDVATPCFSHVIDYMNKDYVLQESTENSLEQILNNDNQFLKLLHKDYIEPIDIVNFKKFHVVDNDRPKLCADRIDGIILSGAIWANVLTCDDISAIVNDICLYINEENEYEFGFKSKDIAQLVIKANNVIDELCHSREDIYMMELLADITKKAIDNHIISYQDLYKYGERNLLYLLNNCDSKDISSQLDIFYNIEQKDIPSIDLPKIKKRVINPLVNGTRI